MRVGKEAMPDNSLTVVLIAGALAALPAAAIESQALGIVEPISAQISQIFPCGHWSQSGRSGYFRILLAWPVPPAWPLKARVGANSPSL